MGRSPCGRRTSGPSGDSSTTSVSLQAPTSRSRSPVSITSPYRIGAPAPVHYG